MSVAELFIARTRQEFTDYRQLAERGMAQIDDTAFFHQPNAESNSIALIVKHMAGNLNSRWTDFLTTDGEKPDRGRDNEFVVLRGDTRATIMARWSHGFAILNATLVSLKADDLVKTVRIRGQELGVMDAVQRAFAHAASHCGQIIYLSKWLANEKWETLSIPRLKA